MTYRTQPLTASSSLTTTPALNTDSTTAVIAAPGAGLRLRIVGWQLAGQQNTTGNIRVIGRSNGSGFFIISAGVVPGGSAPGKPPEPGISCDVNKSFDLIYASNVASQTLRATIYYYIDAIT